MVLAMMPASLFTIDSKFQIRKGEKICVEYVEFIIIRIRR